MDKHNKTFTSLPGAYSKTQNLQGAYKSKDPNISLLEDLNSSKNFTNTETSTLSSDINKFKKLNISTMTQTRDREINQNSTFSYHNKERVNPKKIMPVSIKTNILNLNNSYLNASMFENYNNPYTKQAEKQNLNISTNLPIHINSISITSKNKNSQVYSSDFNFYIIGNKKNKRNTSSLNLNSNAFKSKNSAYSRESSAYKDRKNQSVDCSNTDNTSKTSNNCNEENLKEKLRSHNQNFCQSNNYYNYKKINNLQLEREFSEGILTEKLEKEGNLIEKEVENSYIDGKKIENNGKNLSREIRTKEREYIIENQNIMHEVNNISNTNFNNLTFMSNENYSNTSKIYNLEIEKSLNLSTNIRDKFEENKINSEFFNVNEVEYLEFEKNYNEKIKKSEKLRKITSILTTHEIFSQKIINYFKNKSINPTDENFKLKKFYDEKFPPTYKSFFSYSIENSINFQSTSNTANINQNLHLSKRGSIEDIEENLLNNKKMAIINSGQFNNIVFKRPTEVYENLNFDLFSDKIEENLQFLNEDQVINKSFNTILLTLQKFPYLLYRIFKTNRINYSGYYEVILYLNNKWQIVFIDDFLPFDNKSKTFFGGSLSEAKSEIWKHILEKAIAKASGGYMNFIFLEPNIIFSMLTGFNSVIFENNNFDLFNYILDCIKNNFCLSVRLSELKLDMTKYIYFTVIDAFEIIEQNTHDENEKEIRIIKIRRPSNDFSFNFEIKNFDFITKRDDNILREIIANDELHKYGYFYVNYNDFKENFDYLYCCLTFVNDENLKKLKMKKNVLILSKSEKNNLSNGNIIEKIVESQNFSIKNIERKKNEVIQIISENSLNIINNNLVNKEKDNESNLNSNRSEGKSNVNSIMDLAGKKSAIEAKKKHNLGESSFFMANSAPSQTKNKETPKVRPEKKLHNLSESSFFMASSKPTNPSSEVTKTKPEKKTHNFAESSFFMGSNSTSTTSSNNNNIQIIKPAEKKEAQKIKRSGSSEFKTSKDNDDDEEEENKTKSIQNEKDTFKAKFANFINKPKETDVKTTESKSVDIQAEKLEKAEIEKKSISTVVDTTNIPISNNSIDDLGNKQGTPIFKKEDKKSALRKLKEFEMDTNDFKKMEKMKKINDSENGVNDIHKNMTTEQIYENLRKDSKKDDFSKDIFGPSLIKKEESVKDISKNEQQNQPQKTSDLVASLKDIVNRNKRLKEDEDKKKLEQNTNSVNDTTNKVDVIGKEENSVEKENKINDVFKESSSNEKIPPESQISEYVSSEPDGKNILENKQSFGNKPITPREEQKNQEKKEIIVIEKNQEISESELIVNNENKEIISCREFITEFSDQKTNSFKIIKYYKDLQPIIYKGEKFIDQQFPPEPTSFLNTNKHSSMVKEKKSNLSLFSNAAAGILYTGNESFDDPKIKSKLLYQIKINDIVFKRASDVYDKFSIIDRSFENLELSRSLFEKCLYPLLSILAANPQSIFNLLRTFEKNDYGYYEVNLFIDGIWQVFSLDDYFPFSVSENRFIGYTNIHDQLWPMLLEKAFAKACGGYYEMYCADCVKYLSAFTGMESECLKIQNNEIFEILFENIRKKGILLANTKDIGKNTVNKYEKNGLKATYYYIILDTFELLGTKIIKIGSPWEKIEFEGEYSQNSSNWTENLKNKYFSVNKTIYGFAYLTIDEFIKNFENVYFVKNSNSKFEDFSQLNESKLENENFDVEEFPRENLKNSIYREENSFSMKVHINWENQIFDGEISRRFTDNFFTPNINSLFSLDKTNNDVLYENARSEYENFLKAKKYDNVVWRRISEIDNFPKDLCVIEDVNNNTKWQDVFDQSPIDSYFMTIVICLIKKPHLVDKLIRTKKINKFCYYEVILFVDNEWKIVFVDDYIPYDTEQNAALGARPYNNQIWPLILQKAWAKICGGYLNLTIMSPTSCFVALTGYESGFYETAKIDVFQFTYDSLKNGYFLVAKSKREYNTLGAQSNYYYVLVNCFETNKNGHLFKLLKIRSPWEKFDWSGQWALKSNIWEEETKQIMWKKSIFTKNGFFIVNYEEFVNNFDCLFFCYLNITAKDENKLPNFQKEFCQNEDTQGKVSSRSSGTRINDFKRTNSISSNIGDLKMMNINVSSSSYFSTTKYITPINGFNKYDNSADNLNIDNSELLYFWNLESRSTSNILDILLTKSNKRKKNNEKIINFSETLSGKKPEKEHQAFIDELISVIHDYRNQTDRNKYYPYKILNANPTIDELNLIRFLKENQSLASLIFTLEPGSPLDSKWYFKEMKNNGVWLSQYDNGNQHFALHCVDKHIRMGIYKGNLQWGKLITFDFFYEDVYSNFFYAFEGINIDGMKQGEGKFFKKIGYNFTSQEIVELNFNNNVVQTGRFIMPDGCIWTGPVKSDIFKSGTGTIKTPDGKSWQCTYSMDTFIK